MITSLRNPRILAVRRLGRTRERRATGKTTVDGPFLLRAVVAADIVIHAVFTTADDDVAMELCAQAGVSPSVVSDEVMKDVGSTVNPRGPVAVISIPKPAPLRAIDSIVMWDIADPGNAGTIIRSAAAFGMQVIATQNTVDLWSPKVLRSAVGGHFAVDIVSGFAGWPDDLAAIGLHPFAAVVAGSTDPKPMVEATGPVAVIIGNEAHGVPTKVAEQGIVEKISLAMVGAMESLNAGVAASILMYLRSTRRV